MPSVSCPGCCRSILFEHHELPRVVECAKCGPRFRLARKDAPAAPAPANAFTAPSISPTLGPGPAPAPLPPLTDYPQPRRRSPVMLFAWLAVGVVCLGAVGVFVTAWAVNEHRKEEARVAAGKAIKTPPAKKAEKAEPTRPTEKTEPTRPSLDDLFARQVLEAAAREKQQQEVEVRQAQLERFLWTRFYIVPLVAWLVSLVLMLAWVARDCRARGVDGGAVWVLIIIVSWVVGLLVYMGSRPHGVLVPCSRCGNKRLMAARLCPHCGEPVLA